MAADHREPVARPWRLRVLLHALDRTGPPVLAETFLRWMDRHHPEVAIDVVSFRGGAKVADLEALGSVHVVLDDEEPWDWSCVAPGRVAALRRRLALLPAPDVELLVSVAAGQILPLVDECGVPMACWVVEVGEDLHWVGEDFGWDRRNVRWLAGSEASRAELVALLTDGPTADVAVVPEFVDRPPAGTLADRAGVRARLGAHAGQVVVVGAGIGTHRKGLDLFAEVAMAVERRCPGSTAFAWVGGERDPLHPLVAADIDRFLVPNLVLHPSVPDLHAVLAVADLFVHTARFDAFPLVGLHASLAGVPVLAFAATGGIEEMFGPSFCGVGFPSVGELADLVVSLADPDRRAEVARAQELHVAARFDTEVAAPTLYDQLLVVAS